MKNFPLLEIAEIDIRVNLGSKRTNLDIKTYFFKLNPFSGGKYPNSMNHCSLEREIL